MRCGIGTQTESGDGFMNPSIRPTIDATIQPAIDATIQPTVDAAVRPAVDAALRPAVGSTVEGKVGRVVSTASAKQECRCYQWLLHVLTPELFAAPLARAYDCARRYAS